MQLERLFKQWCKETNRSGGVLVGSSIREFLAYAEEKRNITQLDISKILVDNKYKLPVAKFDINTFVLDIPKASELIYNLIK